MGGLLTRKCTALAPSSRSLATRVRDGGAAHDGVVHHVEASVLDHGAHGIDLHAHAELPHALGGLNEGAAHVVVADEGVFVGHAGFLRHAEGGVDARVREGNDAFGVGHGFADEVAAHALAALIGVFAEEAGVGAREIDEFKDALANGNVVVAQAHAAVFQRARAPRRSFRRAALRARIRLRAGRRRSFRRRTPRSRPFWPC